MIYTTKNKVIKGAFLIFIFMFLGCSDNRNAAHNNNYYKLDFESFDGWSELYAGFLVKEESHGGNYCLNVQSSSEFCGNFKKPLMAINDWPLPFIDAGIWVKSQKSLHETYLVIAIYDVVEKQNKFYELLEFDKFFTKSGDWYHVINRINLLTDINKDHCELSIYVWNKSKEDFFIDDIEFELSKS